MKGIGEKTADGLQAHTRACLYSPESKQRQVEHYQVTLPCEVNAKLIIPIAKGPGGHQEDSGRCSSDKHGEGKEKR
jgi:hypothetical protein